MIDGAALFDVNPAVGLRDLHPNEEFQFAKGWAVEADFDEECVNLLVPNTCCLL